MLPTAGGQYVYLRDAYHPLVAFLYGWALLFMIESGAMAAVAMTFAEYAVRLVTDQPQASALIGAGGVRAVAIGAIVFLSIVNYLGVVPGSRLLNVFVVLKVAALAVLIAAGLFFSGVLDASQQVAAPGSEASLRGVRRGADSDRVCVRRLAERQLRRRRDQGSETHPADLPAGRHGDRGARLRHDQRRLPEGARPWRPRRDHDAGVGFGAIAVRRRRRSIRDRGDRDLDVRVPEPLRAGADARLLRDGGRRRVLPAGRAGCIRSTRRRRWRSSCSRRGRSR